MPSLDPVLDFLLEGVVGLRSFELRLDDFLVPSREEGGESLLVGVAFNFSLQLRAAEDGRSPLGDGGRGERPEFCKEIFMCTMKPV